MSVYVGADWSARRVVCATAVGHDKPRSIKGAEASLDSIRDLLQRVRQRHPEGEEVHVLLESGAAGWVQLFSAAGAVVHVADAKQAKRFAESLCSSGAKADRRDARTLVHMLRSPAHCPAPWEPEPALEPLRRLGTTREQLGKEHTRLVQQVRAIQREYMPLVDACLGALSTRWARRFLHAAPTPWHALRLDRADVERLTKRCHDERREGVWQAIQRTEAPWVDEALADIEALHVRGLLDRLELVVEQLAVVDAKLDEMLSQFAEWPLLDTVGGIGRQLAAVLLQFALGTTPTHRDQAGIQMGASPVFIGSATDKRGNPKGHARMRRAASPRARRGTYLLGRLAQQNLSWARAMYADGLAHGQSSATAYRRIARSLLRILTAMVRDGKPYNDGQYVAALKANGVAWAAGL